MSKYLYTPPEKDHKTVRPSMSIPDQSLSIQEIVKRFVKGIPVDVIQREPIYSDQEEHDLEKLNRMDFGEKAQYARELSERSEKLKSDLDEFERSVNEEKEKEARAKAERIAKKKAAKDGGQHSKP